MPIDRGRALGAELPSRTSSWSDHHVLLYHLAVGAGIPATSEQELTYALERNLEVLPSFGVVAPGIGPREPQQQPPKGGGFSGYPGVDIDLAAILHGGQEIEIHRPIPVEATVSTTGRLVDIMDKGKAAVLVTEAQSVDVADGTPLFTTRSSIFVRGEGGFGGPRGESSSVPAPDREPDLVTESPTLEQQALLYRLCGDRNPLHADPEVARAAGFDRPILHGLCSYGMVCKAVVDVALDGDRSRLARYGARFAGIMLPGETIVTKIWNEADRLIVEADSKERGAPVLRDAFVELSDGNAGR